MPLGLHTQRERDETIKRADEAYRMGFGALEEGNVRTYYWARGYLHAVADMAAEEEAADAAMQKHLDYLEEHADRLLNDLIDLGEIKGLR